MSREPVWVFHAGALGDFVMIWPMLRAIARAGHPLTIVAGSAAKAQLCERVLARQGAAVVSVDGESRRFARLWSGDTCGQSETVGGIGRVYTFVADQESEPGRRWLKSATGMFPGASVEPVGPPGSASRSAAWACWNAGTLGMVSVDLRPDGLIVCHVGAGSESKRWPLERWIALANGPHITGSVDTCLIAGEVEADRFSTSDRDRFESAGGRFLRSLPELVDVLETAAALVAGDTGPTHLAAQMGIPTVALFGPTDPAVWSPVGARVHVVRSATQSMDGISHGMIRAAVVSIVRA